MSKTIRLYDGIRVETDRETKNYPNMDALDVFNIQPEFRVDVIRHLMAFHTLDLTQAYNGKKVVFTLYGE